LGHMPSQTHLSICITSGLLPAGPLLRVAR